MKRWSIWVGFDPREADCFAVAVASLRQHLSEELPINGIVLSRVRMEGLYKRATEKRDGRLFDVISQHPMATEFAISRFLTPHLAKSGLALFMDCDVLVRRDPVDLFQEMEMHSHALMCVKHDHRPKSDTKMGGQIQSSYSKKNYSSVMMFDCDHAANKALTIDLINTVPGRELHQFCWLKEDNIGYFDPAWNVLVGEEDHEDPAIVHFTNGAPSFPDQQDAPFAEEWRAQLASWGANP